MHLKVFLKLKKNLKLSLLGKYIKKTKKQTKKPKKKPQKTKKTPKKPKNPQKKQKKNKKNRWVVLKKNRVFSNPAAPGHRVWDEHGGGRVPGEGRQASSRPTRLQLRGGGQGRGQTGRHCHLRSSSR
jgi:hypothetical protein